MTATWSSLTRKIPGRSRAQGEAVAAETDPKSKRDLLLTESCADPGKGLPLLTALPPGGRPFLLLGPGWRAEAETCPEGMGWLGPSKGGEPGEGAFSSEQGGGLEEGGGRKQLGQQEPGVQGRAEGGTPG